MHFVIRNYIFSQKHMKQKTRKGELGGTSIFFFFFIHFAKFHTPRVKLSIKIFFRTTQAKSYKQNTRCHSKKEKFELFIQREVGVAIARQRHVSRALSKCMPGYSCLPVHTPFAASNSLFFYCCLHKVLSITFIGLFVRWVCVTR